MYVHDDPSSPRLSGQHFRFTIAEASGFVDFENDGSTGFAFSGYAIDIHPRDNYCEARSCRFFIHYILFLPSERLRWALFPLPGKR